MKTKLYYSLLVISTAFACLMLAALQRSDSLGSTEPAASPQTTQAGPDAISRTSKLASSSSTNAKPTSNPSDQKGESVRSQTAAARVAEQLITKDGKVYPLRVYKPALVPNDTYANQWWTANSGMTSVWDLPPPARATKVAIIDTGFALAHQDLSSRWATNTGESGSSNQQGPSALNCTARSLALSKSCNLIDDNFDGIIDNETGPTSKQNPSRLNCSDQGKPITKDCNRIDDEGNGYIDDYRGWDFSNYDNNVQAGEVNSVGSGTTHGTMVAGVLGATGNNGVGIAGVNWHTTILPIQALDDDSYGDSLTVSESIYYATDQGADVISLSLVTSQVDTYIREAVRYATDRGTLVVAATGNEGCRCISYPANFPEVIAVGALAPNNNPASFSNYGPNLDILAPGENMTSTYWTPGNGTNAYVGGIAGTSFATPFVSGLLALGRSYQPQATWDEIVGAMLENTDKRTLSLSSPRSDTLGYGVTRADTMIGRLRTPQASAIRYQLGSNLIQGSKNIYQCGSGLPSTLVYKLTKPNQQSYAVGTLGYYNLTASGWNISEFAFACIGLPTDTPDVVRSIDLNREAFNLSLKP